MAKKEKAVCHYESCQNPLPEFRSARRKYCSNSCKKKETYHNNYEVSIERTRKTNEKTKKKRKEERAKIASVECKVILCENTFVPKHPKHRFCSGECYSLHLSSTKKIMLPLKHCAYIHCENTFTPKTKRRLFCSPPCQGKQWRISNPKMVEKQKENRLRYLKNNPEVFKLYDRKSKAKRRAAITNSQEHFSLSDIRQMFEDQEYLCAYCECNISEGYHIDHMIPLSRGGSNNWDNIALTCESCNLRKGRKTVEEFLNFVNQNVAQNRPI